jgi:hypothetical protein
MRRVLAWWFAGKTPFALYTRAAGPRQLSNRSSRRAQYIVTSLNKSREKKATAIIFFWVVHTHNRSRERLLNVLRVYYTHINIHKRRRRVSYLVRGATKLPIRNMDTLIDLYGISQQWHAVICDVTWKKVKKRIAETVIYPIAKCIWYDFSFMF